MRNGIAAGPLPSDLDLPYGHEITQACAVPPSFSPLLAYAIKVNESGENDPPDVQSGDGGHGLFQLTSSYPDDWADPYANALYAVQYFLAPAETYWADTMGLQGTDLVRAIAAEFNAGRGGAMQGHEEGDVDKFTTNHYAARALAHYEALVAGQAPW
jgi:hypothetical protein